MNELAIVSNILTSEDAQDLQNMMAELADTTSKKQIFRTETEARASVLNDGSFPTPASKYWQAVREQSVQLDQVIILSFDIRRNDIATKRAMIKLEAAKDALDIAEAQIELDECHFKKMNMEQVAHDRIRELKMWSMLKAELNDGSFDTTNPNTHQAESMMMSLVNRKMTLGQGSSQPEILNVLGPLHTVDRLVKEKKLQLPDGSTAPAQLQATLPPPANQAQFKSIA